MRFVSYDHRPVHVNISDMHGIHMHHRGVIEKSAMAPFSTDKAHASISEAVVNAAVKSDMRSPIATVPRVEAVVPAPVAGSPQHPDGSDYPGARHPVVAIIVAP
jgi:hypothetical protein